MASTYTKDFKVAIVGGGVVGLTCAVGLRRAGIKIDIFESAHKFGEVGAGVGLGPNALRALDGLGVLEAVIARSDEPEPAKRPFRFISGHAPHDVIYNYETTPEDCGMGIHRAAFLDALVDLIDPNTTHFNKRCTHVSTSPDSRTSILHFADGTTHEADVVIGADGIKSVVRDAVTGDDPSHLRFTDTVAYRGLIPTETLKLAGVKTDLVSRPVCFTGMRKHIIVFPIKDGQIINVVAFVSSRRVQSGSAQLPRPWVQPVPQQDLLNEFEGWGDDVVAILNNLKTPSKWSIHFLQPPLSSFVRGNVVLIGDAAHGMLPHLGAGAGQGLEDAFILCNLLAHPQTTVSNLEAVLGAYDKSRPPRANMVLERSTEMGNIYDNYGENGYSAQELGSHIEGKWEDVWHHDLEKELREAEEWLKEKGVFV